MPDENKGKIKTIKNLVNVGSNIAGSTGGAIAGFLLGGPPGAIGGAALGPALAEGIKKIGNEIANRLLGPREQIRVGATIIYAAQKIEEKLNAGNQIRSDDFFEDKDGERSAFEELAEGVLRTAQSEYQEKKLKSHGNLLANLVFHSEIDKAQANMLIRLSERLSYRQLCLLSIFGHKDQYNLRKQSYRDKTEDIDANLLPLLQEIYQLYSEGILNSGGDALLGVGDIPPNKMLPQGIGATLHNLMELYNMDKEDLNKIAGMLQ